jgi:uncharacterized membrane protein
MTVSPKRHLAKTISYRILSTSIGFMAMWLVTGSITVGAAFSIIELVWKPIQYYIHERVWYKHIKFGLTKVEEPIKPDLRIMDTMSTGGVSETVTTTSPKRLVYTKKTE